MGKTADAVAATIGAELDSATATFGPMNSAHEGWAVLLEEVDELSEELETVQSLTSGMFQSVRKGDLSAARSAADSISEAAWRAAVEAVQVAAMAQRFLIDVTEESV